MIFKLICLLKDNIILTNIEFNKNNGGRRR